MRGCHVISTRPIDRTVRINDEAEEIAGEPSRRRIWLARRRRSHGLAARRCGGCSGRLPCWGRGCRGGGRRRCRSAARCGTRRRRRCCSCSLSHVLLYAGAGDADPDRLFWARPLLAAPRGTVMELGVAPVVTSWVVVRLLAALLFDSDSSTTVASCELLARCLAYVTSRSLRLDTRHGLS